MAVIRRANNEKISDTRQGGNWRTELAKYAKYLAGIGAVGGLGYMGYNVYKTYKDLQNMVQKGDLLINQAQNVINAPKDIYWGAVHEIVENPKGFEIPGGFPKNLL